MFDEQFGQEGSRTAIPAPFFVFVLNSIWLGRLSSEEKVSF